MSNIAGLGLGRGKSLKTSTSAIPVVGCRVASRALAQPVGIWLCVLLASASLLAQERSQPTTRTEQLETIRRDKIATLWPETQSPLVEQINTLMERAPREGVDTGTGSNGFHVLLGGLR